PASPLSELGVWDGCSAVNNLSEFPFPTGTRRNMRFILEIGSATGGAQFATIIDVSVELGCFWIGISPETTSSVVTPLGDTKITDLHDDRRRRSRTSSDNRVFWPLSALADDALDAVSGTYPQSRPGITHQPRIQIRHPEFLALSPLIGTIGRLGNGAEKLA